MGERERGDRGRLRKRIEWERGGKERKTERKIEKETWNAWHELNQTNSQSFFAFPPFVRSRWYSSEDIKCGQEEWDLIYKKGRVGTTCFAALNKIAEFSEKSKNKIISISFNILWKIGFKCQIFEPPEPFKCACTVSRKAIFSRQKRIFLMSPKTGKSGFYGHFQSSEMAFCVTFGQNNDYFFSLRFTLGPTYTQV